MHVHSEKKAVLTKKINGIIYELLVKTHSDMVYVGDKVTLTERLKEFADLITTSKEIVDNIQEEFNKIYKDAPEECNSFKEVWDYINVDGDPKSALINLIDNKVDKEEGKGLSECDFTHVLREIVIHDYTPAQIDEKFRLVGQHIETVEMRLNEAESRIGVLEDRNNIYLGFEEPNEVKNRDIWYQIIQVEI